MFKEKNIKKLYFICIALLLIAIPWQLSHAQSVSLSRQEKNITAFAHLYGYTRYFHPSDEAQTIKWDYFACYGAQTVRLAPDDATLIKRLQDLFHPIAPTLLIASSATKLRFHPSDLTPPDTTGFKLIYWQHFGLGTPYMLGRGANAPYFSSRQNREGTALNFPRKINFGECIQQELAPGISCLLPLALYGTGTYTYPRADTTALQALKKEMSKVNEPPYDMTAIYLGDVIVAWNVFRHFFPYWEDAAGTPASLLHRALVKTLTDKTPYDFQRTLQQLCVALKDGHMWVMSAFGDTTNTHVASLRFAYAEGEVVVKDLLDTALTRGLRPGDVVDSIDGENALTALSNREQQFSGSPQLQEWKGLDALPRGPVNSNMRLVIRQDGKEKIYSLPRVPRERYDTVPDRRNVKGHKELSPGVYYFDLVDTSNDVIQMKDQLVSAKAIIFDYRGYPYVDYNFIIQQLLTKEDTTHWLFTPQILYPDYKQVTYISEGWDLQPQQPHLNARIYFLSDTRDGSAAESYMSFIKDFKLATIVGQPTGGFNGGINFFDLPAYFQLGFSGMLVTDHYGKKCHIQGFQPDVRVDPTIKGISEGRDEILEKAIELATRPSGF